MVENEKAEMATGGRAPEEEQSSAPSFLQVLHVELLDLLLRLGGDVSLVIRIGTGPGGGGSAAGSDLSAAAITTIAEDDHLLGGANDVALPGEEAKVEEDHKVAEVGDGDEGQQAVEHGRSGRGCGGGGGGDGTGGV